MPISNLQPSFLLFKTLAIHNPNKKAAPGCLLHQKFKADIPIIATGCPGRRRGSVQQRFHCLCCAHNETLVVRASCFFFVRSFFCRFCRALGQTHSLPSLGFSVGLSSLAMCVAVKGWHNSNTFYVKFNFSKSTLFLSFESFKILSKLIISMYML